MELTEKQKDTAENFIQKFPHMTFKNARTEFEKLHNTTQKEVLKTVDKNKTLSVALRLTFLPQELQYEILNGKFNRPANLDEIMDDKSIYGHFRWLAMVDKKWQKNSLYNHLDIVKSNNDHCYNAYNHSAIRLTKQELFNLNYDKIAMLQKIQIDRLSKQKLLLFNTLPNDLQNKFKNCLHSCDNLSNCMNWSVIEGKWYYDYDKMYHDRRIKFSYHNKLTPVTITKAAFKSCKSLLPFIIPPLLYAHLYLAPMEKLWTQIQNPSLLEENREKELTNALIDNLKANLKPGSKLLEKKIIAPVLFEWVFPQKHKMEYFIKNLILTCIMSTSWLKYSYNLFFYSPAYQSDIYESNEGVILGYICLNIGNFIIHFSLSQLNIILPCLSTMSQHIFAYGIPIGLISITATTSLYGIIKAIINSYELRKKSIDLTKEKFKNKSIKEVINHYLQKPSIEIQ